MSRLSRTLLATGLLTSVVTLSGVAIPQLASAGDANDPYAAVTYQQDPVHDGDYSDPSFTAPLAQAWSVDLGATVGYPVIADGRVFVAVDHNGAYGLDVEARSLASGKLLWGPTSIGGTYSSGALAYDQGRVFALNFDGKLTAFDAATGDVDWVAQIGSQWSFTSAPTAVDGTVYVGGAGSGGTLYAVDETTGDATWTASVENGDDSSPVVSADGVYVSYACEQAYRFDHTGALVWHHATDCEGGGGRTAVLHDGDLYIRDDAGKAPAVLDASTGTSVGAFASDTAPAFDGSFMSTEQGGFLYGWDADTGTRLWKSTGSGYVTAPLIAGGYVVEGRSDGIVELRHENDGTLAWSGRAGSQILAPDEHNADTLVGLAVGDGSLVVPAGSTLTAFAPTGDDHVTLLGGPAEEALAGRTVSFSFTSEVDDPTYTCTLDGDPEPCTSPVTYRQLSAGEHTFSVSIAGSTTGSATRDFRVDSESPRVRLGRFHPFVTHAPTATSHWRGTDSSGVDAYQLRVRRAHDGSPLSPWATHRVSSSTSEVLHLRRSSRVCVSVRAEDGVGNWSGWAPAQCVVREPRKH